jgi:hypothetical protein
VVAIVVTIKIAKSSDWPHENSPHEPRQVIAGHQLTCATMPELTADLVVSLWVPNEVRLSPDGRRVAWTAAPNGRALAWGRLRLDVVLGRDSAVRLHGRLGFRPTGRCTPMPRDSSLVEDEMMLPLR